MSRGLFITGILLVIALGVYLDAVDGTVFLYTFLSLAAYGIVCALYIKHKEELDKEN